MVCETPEVNYNGSAITIAVNLDGETVNAEDYITVERYTSDPVYNHFIRVNDAGDNYKNMLVYDFDVADYGSSYYLDCTSIKVIVKGDYIVQGISSNQSYGKGEGSNVTANADGSYIVYNVADGVGDIDATIYLRTKYDVEYYVDDEPYEVTDDNVYVKSYGVSETSGSIEPGKQDKFMKWKNPDCSNTISLIDLPDNAEGWYAYGTGEALTGEVKVKNYLPTGDSTTIKFYAKTKDEPETPVKTDYLAGFFVLMPDKMDDSFVPGGVYPTDSYYPNTTPDTVTTASNPEGEVDDTTGYIGYLTEAGYKYFLEQAKVNSYDELTDVVRVTIPADKVDEYLIVPEGEELGTVWTEYLADGTHQLVCYQMNNSTLGANWPSRTDKDGTQYDTHEGKTFHVDCYVEGVDVAVTYDANYEGGTVYKHETVNGQPIKSGDSYTVLDIDDTGITREGFDFVGWSTSKSGTPLVTEINPLMTDTILYAVWEEKEEPEQPTMYKIYVTVHNGTATFYGSEVETYILAVEGEDITITFTPDEGYTLDYATIDGNTLQIPDGGVYTLKLVDSDHTIEVFYAEDELGGGEDGNEPDGTPDYRQVFVKYVAEDENGFVTPSFDTFNLEVDENGKVMTDVALSLNGKATPNADATFAYWTIEGLGYDGGAYSYEADLSGKDFTGYVAGETYTFTAYFTEQPTEYKITVEVVNGTAEFKGTNIGANSVISVYPIKDDNKNVEITFVPTDGYVFDAAYVDDESITLSENNSYTFGEVTADVTIKVLFKQDSVPITPVTPLPTPGEISDLIKDSITVDCVNGEVAHADKVYGLLDGSLVKVEKTDDTSIKVTLDATAYQAQYNTDTETKHDLADGQSATVTFALNYVDQTWRVAEGELPITIKVVCETPVEPDPDITDFSKTLLTDRDAYKFFDIAYPEFYHGDVVVDEGEGVTLIYRIVVEGTPGTAYTISDPGARLISNGSWTGTIDADGRVSILVAKTFTWREIRRADELTNTAAVLLDGEVADSDTETVDVDIDWDYNPPVVDDDDDEDEDDEVFVPNWLNTEDHYSYIVGYEDGTIKPNNNITRAEVATIFYRLLTDSSRERWYTDSNSFTDVADDSWYNEPVSTLSRMGIINGYEDGSFKPNAPITRAEFTAIATRFFDYSARYDGAFYDVSAGSWYADYIQAAVDMGLVEGYPDGGVHPGSNITRAEAVTIVNRVLNRVPHEDHLLSTRVMNTWPDNKPGAWYYADMQEATNSHDYDWTRVDGKLVEDWTNKLADPNW